ncbi:conjugal transfer protein [Streptomyces sp. NPDC059828]|uniref:conjugal transfer protein n=1 Tax=Streptomyces sp. NPDC059828 TaxID=3346965 RepID=UPI0036643BFA
MSVLKTVVWKVLNLPEPRKDTPAPQPEPPQQRTTPSAGAAQWVAAGKRVQAERNGQGKPPVATESTQARTPVTPWALQEEKSGTRALVTAGRIALWAVVALAAITGVRSWFWPSEPAPAPAPKVQQGPTYPVQDAQSIAARFAYSYLTWDEAKPDERAKALARDMPKGVDTTAGWNSKGQQSVLIAQPGQVAELGNQRARVHVDVLVNTPGETTDKKKTQPAVQKWIGLEVPVLYTSGRIVVTGEPGIVGVPTSGPSVTDQNAADSDVELSAQTKSTVDTFFTEYAKGEADSVTAPGASVPPLPAGMTLMDVQSWNVDQGKGTDRTGTAVVRWQIGDAELEQTYRVELTRVASAAAERWQVAEVHGGAS